MKTDWKVRPDNIGHYIWRGCFRCHDGLHADKTGRTITNECNTCHAIIAQGSQLEPGEVSLQGLKFDHPGGEIPPESCVADAIAARRNLPGELAGHLPHFFHPAKC